MAHPVTHTLNPALSKWEALPGSSPFPQETIHCQILAAAATVPPESHAVHGPAGAGGKVLTYQELIQKAFSLALALGSRQPDTYVAVLMPRDVEYVVCMLGIMLSGSAYLALSSTIPEERIHFILEDSCCDMAVTTAEYQHLLGSFAGQVLLFANIAPVPLDASKMERMAARAGVSNLAYAIYTSGTTGKPKGVEVEHLGVANMLHHHRTRTVDREDVQSCVIVASFLFDSSVRETFLPLVSGTCLCIAENVLNITEGTCSGGTPSGLAVAQLPKTMRAVLVGGERLTPQCVKNLASVSKVINVYGPTETTVECTTHWTDSSKPSEIALIGRPIGNVSAYGVNPETLAIVERGQQGELWISGPGVARGYRRRPELNAQKFIENPFGGGRLFRTGDLVRWGEGGELDFLGRTDSQVKIRGYRVELEEIEKVCSEVPSVTCACVVVAKDLRGQDQIVAYVEPFVAEDEVKSFAASKLPPYMVPAKVVSGVGLFVLTTNGKVDKKQLPPPAWDAPEADLQRFVDPATPMERALANLIEGVFNIRCSADANLFGDLGLTSLDCAVLVAEARDAGVSIPGTPAVLANPTVQLLARFLEEQSGESEQAKKQERQRNYESQTLVPFEEAVRIKKSVICRPLQYAVFAVGFLLQVLLCYFPPLAACCVVFAVAHSRWGFWGTVVSIGPLFAVCTPLVMLWTVAVKWMVIGRYRQGVFAVGSWYYVRWWFVHGFVTFINTILLGPLRNTVVLNLYLRALGMRVGKNVLVDTTAILEADLMTLGDGARIQSDALLCGHALRWLEDVGGQVLILSEVSVSAGTTVGPGATVAPFDTRAVRVTENLPALTSNQMLKDDYASIADQILWQPRIGLAGQVAGLLLTLALHWVTLSIVAAYYYWWFVWQSPHPGWFALWWMNVFWVAGIPMLLMVAAFKWTVIGRFKEGPSTPWSDYTRFLLQMMLQSRLLLDVITLGASSPIIVNFYRLMGAKIGWNAQVMPCTLVEFDLVSIGESVAFGGLVSFFPRDRTGRLRRISIGHNSAVTNSAIVMSGARVGDNSLIGNLTLCPADAQVPDGTKCVGNPMIRFTNDSQTPVRNRWRSNLVMFGHLVASYLVELISLAPLLFNSLLSSPFAYSKVNRLIVDGGQLALGPLVEAALVLPTDLFINLTAIILSRRLLCQHFTGKHLRDSWLFVQFIYYTKQMMWNDAVIFRMLNGTPFMPLIYRLMGGDMDSTALLFFRHCADFDRLRIGPKAVVSFDSYLELHQKTASELLFEPVEIGASAVVGARSILLRGSMLAQKSVVSTNSTVLPGEEVRSRSVIGLNPGRTVVECDGDKRSQDSIVAATARRAAELHATLSASGDQQATVPESVPARRTSFVQTSSGGALPRRISVNSAEGRRPSVASVAWSQASSGGGPVVARRRSGTAGAEPGRPLQVEGTLEKLDHVIVGAGLCGLVAAQEVSAKGRSYAVLERTHDLLGCWKQSANATSHVAVCEPSYRLTYPRKGSFPSDFTGRDELLEDGARYVEHHKIEIRYGSNVKLVERKGSHWEVTYIRDGAIKTIQAKAVLLALGAQQVPRLVRYKGEEGFLGTISSGIKDHMPLDRYKGARVVIVGGGAFAVENLRTALMHGAKHVTIVYRNAIQCWPRVIHYLATLGNITLGQLAEPYETAVKWAGLEGKVEPFMSRQCTAQPTASDIFFLAHKAGLMDLKKGQVAEVLPDGVRLENGEVLPCDVLLKCIGWEEPNVRAVVPDFATRRFVFLNGHSSLAFVSDPHYQHRSGSNAVLKMLRDVPLKGGTFSVLALATVVIRLQLFFLERPDQYKLAMQQLTESPEPVCNWFQQRWQFEGLPEVNAVIDAGLDQFKEQTRAKYPDVSAYLAMSRACYERDAARFMFGQVPYIFQPDGSGNFVDLPQQTDSPEEILDLDKLEAKVKAAELAVGRSPVAGPKLFGIREFQAAKA